MKSSPSGKVSTLAATLTIAFPLTLIPPAVAQSDVRGKLTDVTTAINDGPIISNAPPAPLDRIPVAGSIIGAGLTVNSAVLAIGNYSNAHMRPIDLKGHCDLSNIGSNKPEVQATPKDIIPAISSGYVLTASCYTLAPYEIQSADERIVKCSGAQAVPGTPVTLREAWRTSSKARPSLALRFPTRFSR